MCLDERMWIQTSESFFSPSAFSAFWLQWPQIAFSGAFENSWGYTLAKGALNGTWDTIRAYSENTNLLYSVGFVETRQA